MLRILRCYVIIKDNPRRFLTDTLHVHLFLDTRWYFYDEKQSNAHQFVAQAPDRGALRAYRTSRRSWFSIELLGSLNTSDTSHSSRVGEENGIITSACLTEGGTLLLQHVKITHDQWSALDNIEAKIIDAKKNMRESLQCKINLYYKTSRAF